MPKEPDFDPSSPTIAGLLAANRRMANNMAEAAAIGPEAVYAIVRASQTLSRAGRLMSEIVKAMEGSIGREVDPASLVITAVMVHHLYGLNFLLESGPRVPREANEEIFAGLSKMGVILADAMMKLGETKH